MGAPAPGLFSPPRIIVAGRPRDPLLAPDGLADALGRLMPVRIIDAGGTPFGMLRLLRQGSAAARGGQYEALHLLDARLAPAAIVLRARYGLPMTVELSARDMPGRGSSILRLARRADMLFAPADIGVRAEQRVPGLHVRVTSRVASRMREPSRRALDRMVRRLRDITPGRLVVAVPWPEDREQMRWLRDSVVPLLHGKPVVLLLGAPGRRDARLLTGAMGMQRTYRVHAGALDADTLAAAARCADVFVVPAAARRARDLDDFILALTASGVPVVAGGGVRAETLAHERNALVANAEDATSLVSTLNDLIALPAAQRHFLGEEFAAYSLQRWSWEDAAGVYAASFASLVGRPQIPAELRAA